MFLSISNSVAVKQTPKRILHQICSLPSLHWIRWKVRAGSLAVPEQHVVAFLEEKQWCPFLGIGKHVSGDFTFLYQHAVCLRKVVDVGRKEAAWLVSKTNWNRNSDWSLIMVTDGFEIVLCSVMIAIASRRTQKIKRSCDIQT
jgi:hypothetical protein